MAKLLRKTRSDVEEILRNNDIIELNLSERKSRNREDDDDLNIYE